MRRWVLVSCPVCPAPAPRTPAPQPNIRRKFFKMWTQKAACSDHVGVTSVVARCFIWKHQTNSMKHLVRRLLLLIPILGLVKHLDRRPFRLAHNVFCMFRRIGTLGKFNSYWYTGQEHTVQTQNLCGDVRTRDGSNFTWWQKHIKWPPVWSQAGPTGQFVYTSFGVLASQPPSPR